MSMRMMTLSNVRRWGGVGPDVFIGQGKDAGHGPVGITAIACVRMDEAIIPHTREQADIGPLEAGHGKV